MTRDETPFGLPKAAEEYTAAQYGMVHEDADHLVRAGSRLRMLVDSGQHEVAARTARAWASFALAIAGRIELTVAYTKGIRDATIEPVQEVPITVTASNNLARAAVILPFRPVGTIEFTLAATYDCGPRGRLTAAQMAKIAKVSTSAMYRRLKRGVPPEVACLPMGKFCESGHFRQGSRAV